MKGCCFPFKFVSSMSYSTAGPEKKHVLLPPRFDCPFLLISRSQDELNIVNKYLSLINHCDYRKPFVVPSNVLNI